MPAGLSLSSGGVLSGAPTLAGAYAFSVLVVDSSTGTGPYFKVANYSVDVTPAITQASASLAATATTFVISGFGFDPTAANDQVAPSSGAGTVTAATSTKLTVTLSSPPSVGSLTASVTVDGVSSPAQTSVATVVPGAASGGDAAAAVRASWAPGR